MRLIFTFGKQEIYFVFLDFEKHQGAGGCGLCSGSVFLLIKGRQGVEKKSSQEGESVGKKIPDPEPIKDRM